MRLHASCAARLGPDGYEAVLLLGPPGAGKSGLVLQLIQAGFMLVADDQVLVERGTASAPAALAGLLEVRGLGIFRLPCLPSAPLRLVIRLGQVAQRLPEPGTDPHTGLPAVTIDPACATALARVTLALDAACGHVAQLAGAFTA